MPMNSMQRSVNSMRKAIGKFDRFRTLDLWPFLFIPILAFGLSACTSADKDQEIRFQLKEEVSLKADRSKLDEFRKDIPEEKRIENDEKALMLKLMGELKLHPSKVRNKWRDLVRKKRNRNLKALKKVRNDYSQAEKKRREEFLLQAKKDRKDFRQGKPDRERTKEFYAEQDRNRKEFFADQKDKRKDFESQVRKTSEEFNSYMQEKNSEFNEQYRLYYKGWQEREKERKKAKRAAKRKKYRRQKTKGRHTTQIPDGIDPQFFRDFEEMKNKPETRLVPDDSKDSGN